jgi:hypothetical protein
MDRQTATELLNNCTVAFEQLVDTQPGNGIVARAFDELYQAGCRMTTVGNNCQVRSRGVIERATIDMFDYVFAPHMVPKN